MSEKYNENIWNTNISEWVMLKPLNSSDKKQEKIDKTKINEAFDNFFSSNKLNKILNNKKENNKKNKIKELLKSEFWINKSINLEYYINDFFNYLKNNQNALNIVVENWLFDLMNNNSCPDDKDINELKKTYRENHINNIEKALKNFQVSNGTKIDVDKLFQTEKKCDPLNLVDKLKNLKDKNGNKLKDKQIKQILKWIIFVKEINTEEELTKEIFGKNEDKKNTYLEYMVNMKFYFKKLTKKEDKINFIKQTLTKIWVNINKDKLEKLLDYTKRYIKLKENEDLKDVNKYLNKIKWKNNKQEKITDFSKDLPKEYNDEYFWWFYKTAFEEEKFAWKYILDEIQKKLNISKNSFLYDIINKALTSIDINKKSTANIANNIIESLSNIEKEWFIPDEIKSISKEIIKKLKKISNNARELDFFFKNWYLTNTETIWLYNNKPEKLEKYNIDNFSKAPNTLGHNQITTRAIFVEHLKKDNLDNINSHWLIDYFLKAKIKTWNWNDAISYIYHELRDKKLWDKKFKEIVNHVKNDKKWRFSKFINNKKEILDTLVNFSNFNDKDKISKDIKILSWKENIATDKTIQSIKKNWTIWSKEQDTNFIKWAIRSWKNNNITDMSSTILKHYTTNPDNISEIATKLKSWTEKEKKVWEVLSWMAWLAKELKLKITDIPPEAFNKLNNQILVNPDQAVSDFVDALLKSWKIEDEGYFHTAGNIFKHFEKQFSQDKINLNNIFNKLKQLKDKNITEKDINNINKWINSLWDIWKRIFKTSIQNSHLPENIKNKLLNWTLDEKVLEKKVLKRISAAATIWGLVEKNVKIVLDQTPEKFKHIKNAMTALWINPQYFSQIDKFFTSDDIKDRNFDAFIQYLHKNNISYNEKNTKSIYDNLMKKLKENTKETAKSQEELLNRWFYTKAEQKEIYQNIYYNTYLDDSFKKQFKEKLEKRWIKLDEDKKTTQSNSVYAKNISETWTEKVLEQKNIFLDYQKKDGLVEIKNPFYDKNSVDPQETIKALNIKEANIQLLLKYIQKSGFFKVDELNLWKDSMKILNQFDIDIDKELTLEDIKEFSKKFISWIFFLLKDKSLSSIQKQYIKKYEKSFMQNPDDISLHEDIMTFLNDNSDLLTKIGIYDFTEEKLNLENIPSNKTEKYRDYLRKYDLW